MTIINAVAGAGDDAKLVSIDNAVTEFPQTFSPPTGYDGLSSVTVQAPANFKASNIKKDVEIAGVTGTYEGDVDDELLKQLTADTLEVIPASVTEGLSATPIYWAYGKTALKEVQLSDSVTTIGEASFRKCTNLTTINTGRVTTFGYYAMMNATNLKSVDLSSATYLNQYCFQSTGLESVKIPQLCKMSGGCFRECYSLKTAEICTAGGSNDEIFASCTALTDVRILDGSTAINSRAFIWCDKLVNLVLEPVTPPTLGTNALLGTSSSLVITVPKGSLDAYKSATNWSAYADKMVEAEE